MFKTTILNANRILFEGDVASLFLPGTTGEFEILDFHKPIVSLLREGAIVIDWERRLNVRSGVIRMDGREAVAIVEE